MCAVVTSLGSYRPDDGQLLPNPGNVRIADNTGNKVPRSAFADKGD
jgi:hypothetical protein